MLCLRTERVHGRIDGDIETAGSGPAPCWVKWIEDHVKRLGRFLLCPDASGGGKLQSLTRCGNQRPYGVDGAIGRQCIDAFEEPFLIGRQDRIVIKEWISLV